MAEPAHLQYPPESSLPVILWVVPLFAATLLPGSLWLVLERPYAARIELAAMMTLIVAAVAALTLAALSRGFRYRIRWSLGVTAITTVALFQWPSLTYAGDLIADALPVPLLADAAPVLIAAALLWLAVRRAGDWQFPTLVGGGLLALVALLVATTVPYVTDPEPVSKVATAEAPDVVVLILDGYTRSDVLADQFEFDNSAFLVDLRERGFVIADRATANYTFTYAALASIFSLDYAFLPGKIDGSDRKQMREALSGDSTMMREFKSAGYEVAYLENAWEGSHCGPLVDICGRSGLVERAASNVGKLTILAPILNQVRPPPFNTVSFEHLIDLDGFVAAERRPGTPRLTVAHVILPHAPYLLDAACDRHNTSQRRRAAKATVELTNDRRTFYTGQLTCTNRMVVDSLDAILAANDDTIVMITADHGSGSARLPQVPLNDWTDAEIEERLSILSAYRIPGCTELIYPSITPINGARVVTGCALNETITPLGDDNYWVPSDGAGETITIESSGANR